MYKYTLKPYLHQRLHTGYWSGQNYGYVHQIMKDNHLSGFTIHDAIAHFSNVVFYSNKQVLQIPARNGILLPVALYDEVEI